MNLYTWVSPATLFPQCVKWHPKQYEIAPLSNELDECSSQALSDFNFQCQNCLHFVMGSAKKGHYCVGHAAEATISYRWSQNMAGCFFLVYIEKRKFSNFTWDEWVSAQNNLFKTFPTFSFERFPPEVRWGPHIISIAPQPGSAFIDIDIWRLNW